MLFSTTKAPTLEPVTLQDVKDHLRLSGAAHDANLHAKIVAARSQVEGLLHRAIMDQTITTWYDPKESGAPIRLVRPDLIELASLTTYDNDSAATTVSTANYRVSDYSEPIVEALLTGWIGTASTRTRKNLRIISRHGYVSVTSANGAGTAATTLNLNDASVHASRHAGYLVRSVTRTTSTDYRLNWQTTVSSVTDADTVVLAAAQTWASGDVILIGEVPEAVRLEILRRVVRYWRHTGEAVVGHNVADAAPADLLRGHYYNVW